MNTAKIPNYYSESDDGGYTSNGSTYGQIIQQPQKINCSTDVFDNVLNRIFNNGCVKETIDSDDDDNGDDDNDTVTANVVDNNLDDVENSNTTTVIEKKTTTNDSIKDDSNIDRIDSSIKQIHHSTKHDTAGMEITDHKNVSNLFPPVKSGKISTGENNSNYGRRNKIDDNGSNNNMNATTKRKESRIFSNSDNSRNMIETNNDVDIEEEPPIVVRKTKKRIVKKRMREITDSSSSSSCGGGNSDCNSMNDNESKKQQRQRRQPKQPSSLKPSKKRSKKIIDNDDDDDDDDVEDGDDYFDNDLITPTTSIVTHRRNGNKTNNKKKKINYDDVDSNGVHKFIKAITLKDLKTRGEKNAQNLIYRYDPDRTMEIEKAHPTLYRAMVSETPSNMIRRACQNYTVYDNIVFLEWCEMVLLQLCDLKKPLLLLNSWSCVQQYAIDNSWSVELTKAFDQYQARPVKLVKILELNHRVKLERGYIKHSGQAFATKPLVNYEVLKTATGIVELEDAYSKITTLNFV